MVASIAHWAARLSNTCEIKQPPHNMAVQLTSDFYRNVSAEHNPGTLFELSQIRIGIRSLFSSI